MRQSIWIYQHYQALATRGVFTTVVVEDTWIVLIPWFSSQVCGEIHQELMKILNMKIWYFEFPTSVTKWLGIRSSAYENLTAKSSQFTKQTTCILTSRYCNSKGKNNTSIGAKGDEVLPNPASAAMVTKQRQKHVTHDAQKETGKGPTQSGAPSPLFSQPLAGKSI